MVTEVIFIFFLLCALTQVGFLLYYYVHIFSLPDYKIRDKPSLPASVIICARNEADNLSRYLPAILAQRYTNELGNYLYEVIVVNDASDDNTELVLAELSKEYEHLTIVNVLKNEERIYPGKKFALSKGVAAAKHDIFLMTDADCEPSSDLWLSHMVVPFYYGKEIVAGYGKYRRVGNKLNTFVRWETVHTFLQYATHAIVGSPYMGVGRNLAYTRASYNKAVTTKEWNMLPSGDDDLLIRAAATKDNTAIVSHKDAFTITDAKADVSSWVLQKQRHLSTGKLYRFFTKVQLGKYAFSHAFTWLLFLFLIFTPFRDVVLGIMTARCMVYWLVWWQTACILDEKKLIRYFPLLDFAWMIYNFAFSPYIIWKNKKQWT